MLLLHPVIAEMVLPSNRSISLDPDPFCNLTLFKKEIWLPMHLRFIIHLQYLVNFEWLTQDLWCHVIEYCCSFHFSSSPWATALETRQKSWSLKFSSLLTSTFIVLITIMPLSIIWRHTMNPVYIMLSRFLAYCTFLPAQLNTKNQS